MSQKSSVLTSQTPLLYDSFDRESFSSESVDMYQPSRLLHSLVGLQIPALPFQLESGLSTESQLSFLRHRFAILLRTIHQPNARRSISLHVMSHPERARIGSQVGIYLLCRVAGTNFSQTATEADRLAEQIQQVFPYEGPFRYARPIRLNTQQIRDITFQNVDSSRALHVSELRKYEDYLGVISANDKFIPAESKLDYIAHPFWIDSQIEPWLILIEMLATYKKRAAITVMLEPTDLFEIEVAAMLAEQFHSITDSGSRRREMLDQVALSAVQAPEKRTWIQKISLARAYQAQGLTDFLVNRAKLGSFSYDQLLSWKDQLFLSRIMITVEDGSGESLEQMLRTILSSPSQAELEGRLGWVRPSLIYPSTPAEKEAALHNLWWMGHREWGMNNAHPKLKRLRSIVTAQEIVGLFHVPVLPQAGHTSAISSIASPFIVPPEVAASSLYPEDEKWVEFGYLYQRERWLSVDEVGEPNALPFKLRLSDLEKPSLLVGAPGSGKTNLALYLLAQLWKTYRMPFLVLDPSTGLEYRYLFSEPTLRQDLIVYTTGDEDTFPFRFNPFVVPPGVTVRAHITRLLACFKAAYEMWDPLPAIYESALTRVYTSTPFNWDLEEKGGGLRLSPCFADFASAVIIELEENVLPDYGVGTEAAGILLGASKIRVNGILNNLGHILNVRQNDPDFFQRLLSQPVVIELGAIGDSNSIALVMAFLITQLVGHIEHSFRRGERTEKPHLLLLEEAHRLLSAEQTSNTPNQGNVRSKSAEELNTLLAEVRKYRQGIMVLDQRPSSLVGGVLDNTLINIMCRLNDRVGFKHLSDVLNLSTSQQQYARSRMTPGQAIMLDIASGQPVLVKAPVVVEAWREARLNTDQERDLMIRNAERANLMPPEVESKIHIDSAFESNFSSNTDIWTQFDARTQLSLIEALKPALEQVDGAAMRRAMRAWLTRNRAKVNPVLELALFCRILEQMERPDNEQLTAAFEQSSQ